MRVLVNLVCSFYFIIARNSPTNAETVWRSSLDASTNDTLRSDRAADGNDALINGSTALRVQGDGNLVLYSGNRSVWNSGTTNHGYRPYSLVMQSDNNLVLHDVWNRILWTSGTSRMGLPGARLVVRNDNTASIVDPSGVILWRNGRAAPRRPD